MKTAVFPSPLTDRRTFSPACADEIAAADAAAAGTSVSAVPRAGFPSRILLLLIALYQRTLSPLLPVVTLGRCGCRFSPTCSHYAADAIRTHGALRGFALAAVRLVKCTPLHPGGLDPVPPRRSAPRRCTRSDARSLPTPPASSLSL